MASTVFNQLYILICDDEANNKLEIPFKPPRKCGSCYKIFEPTLKPNGKPYLTCNQCLTWSRKSRINYKNLK
jgi:hypothetical protein